MGMAMPWWGWALVGWTALAIVAAPLLGSAMHEADRRERVVQGLEPATAVRTVRRRRMPVPPLAVGLLLTGVVLEAVGYVVRASGQEDDALLRWSMDAPLGVPRMFVAAVFLAAGIVALVGAVRGRDRRPWWTTVGLVALGIAQVKA